MRLLNRCLLLLLSLEACLVSGAVQAYGPDNHQVLTFVAARAVNRCLEDAELPRLTALQVRYLVRANVSLADRNPFVRLFRWNYYNRADAGERSLLWVMDTRLHEHFNELLLRLESSQELPERYADLGRVISYLQDVTTPSRAVPVYANRFWRFSFSDRFDTYPVDAEAVEDAVADSCGYVLQAGHDPDQLLADAASDTLTAVQAPIFGMPATWEAFWRLADDEDAFGEYGAAGNSFGRNADFDCGDGQRCVLLEDDPLYRDFALERHVEAVIATMRAMLLMQRAEAAPTGTAGPG